MTNEEARIIAGVFRRFCRGESIAYEEARPAVRFLVNLRGFSKDAGDAWLWLNHEWTPEDAERFEGMPDREVIRICAQRFEAHIRDEKRKERQPGVTIALKESGLTIKDLDMRGALSYADPIPKPKARRWPKHLIEPPKEALEADIRELKGELVPRVLRRLRELNTKESKILLSILEPGYREYLKNTRTAAARLDYKIDRERFLTSIPPGSRISSVVIMKPRKKAARKGR